MPQPFVLNDGASLVLAPIYISPSEVSLLILTENLFNPLWVYLGVGERPSDWTFAGGSVVLAVLVAHEARSAYLQCQAAAEAEAEEQARKAAAVDDYEKSPYEPTTSTVESV